MKELEEVNALEKTYALMENYNEMQRYMKEAISEAEQLEDETMRESNAYLDSIRKCKIETAIMLAHIDKAMESLERESNESQEAYKFDAMRMRYVEGRTYQDVIDKYNCGKNAPKLWCKTMIERLAVKIYGSKALEERKKKK